MTKFRIQVRNDGFMDIAVSQFKGHKINRKHVQRLMQLGSIQAIYPGPNTSRRNKLHAVHPYLLRDLEIFRPKQARMIDITYLRMRGGFMYLVALIDAHSRCPPGRVANFFNEKI